MRAESDGAEFSESVAVLELRRHLSTKYHPSIHPSIDRAQPRRLLRILASDHRTISLR